MAPWRRVRPEPFRRSGGLRPLRGALREPLSASARRRARRRTSLERLLEIQELIRHAGGHHAPMCSAGWFVDALLGRSARYNGAITSALRGRCPARNFANVPVAVEEGEKHVRPRPVYRRSSQRPNGSVPKGYEGGRCPRRLRSSTSLS